MWSSGSGLGSTRAGVTTDLSTVDPDYWAHEVRAACREKRWREARREDMRGIERGVDYVATEYGWNSEQNVYVAGRGSMDARSTTSWLPRHLL